MKNFSVPLPNLKIRFQDNYTFQIEIRLKLDCYSNQVRVQFGNSYATY